MGVVEGRIGAQIEDAETLLSDLSDSGLPSQALRVTRGDSLSFTVRVYDLDGSLFNLTGYEAGVYVVRPGDAAPLIGKESDGLSGGADAQVQIADQNTREGEFDVHILASDTEIQPRSYVWTAVVLKPADDLRHTVLAAKFIVAPSFVGDIT